MAEKISTILLLCILFAMFVIQAKHIEVMGKRLAVLEQEEPKTISILATHKDGKYKVVDVWEETD